MRRDPDIMDMCGSEPPDEDAWEKQREFELRKADIEIDTMRDRALEEDE